MKLKLPTKMENKIRLEMYILGNKKTKRDYYVLFPFLHLIERKKKG